MDPQYPIAGQEYHIAATQDGFAAPPPPIVGQGFAGIQRLSPPVAPLPVDFSSLISLKMQIDIDVNNSPAWGTDAPLSHLYFYY